MCIHVSLLVGLTTAESGHILVASLLIMTNVLNALIVVDNGIIIMVLDNINVMVIFDVSATVQI